MSGAADIIADAIEEAAAEIVAAIKQISTPVAVNAVTLGAVLGEPKEKP